MSLSTRRLAALELVLGAWLALGVGTWWAAGTAFRTASDLASEADPRVRAALPAGAAAEALTRHQAGRLNQAVFRGSGRVQLVLGGLAVALAAWPPRAGLATVVPVAAAAALAALLSLVLEPALLAATEPLALVPRPLPPDLEPAAARVGRLHAAFGGLDLLRAGLVLVGAWTAARSRR